MKKDKLIIGILFLLFICLCAYPVFVNLGDLSARKWDESRNGINAMEMLSDHNYFVTQFNGVPDMWNTKPPLFIWSAALCMKFLGTTVLALRLPSALSCLVIVIYAFWFFRRNYGLLIPGMLTGFVLVTSIGFMNYHVARNGDFDAMLSMWIFLYATQFFLYFEYGKQKHLWRASLFLGLAILTKGIAGCLFLPGIFLFMCTRKQYFSALRRWSFYAVPLAGIALGVSYYLIRERLNPGYIHAVIENEFTGRYSATNEGHSGGISYYLDLWLDLRYRFWIWWLIPSMLIVFLRGAVELKRIMLFLVIQVLMYYVVLTVSKTKLPWYDAPFYAFFAMIIGLGVAQLLAETEKLIKNSPSLIRNCVFAIACAALFIIPVTNLFGEKVSVSAKKETSFPEQFYGDFISSVFGNYPRQKKLFIVSEDYNPHLLFYTFQKKYKDKVVVVPRSYRFTENDTFMTCEPAMYPPADTTFAFDTIFHEDYFKYLIRVMSKEAYAVGQTERMVRTKIMEIEGNSDWAAAIRKKADEKHVPFEDQVGLDAIWSLKEAGRITPEESDRLSANYLH
ncbi:MAG: ArnT family glycosyltransferase [Bacteroidia bacterium]